MPTAATHRVFRCIVEVQGMPRAAAAEWRQRLRGLWDNEFARGLDAEFDLVSPADEVVRFDRLEVELRVSERADPVEIGHAFRQTLHERLRSQPLGRRGVLPRDGRAAEPEPAELREWLELWLVTSLVPWWAGKPSSDEIAAHLLERLRTPPGPSWLLAIMARHPAIARRLALQFGDSWQQSALTAVWPSDSSAVTPAITALAAAASAVRAANQPGTAAELWEAGWRLWAGATAPSFELRAAAGEAVETQELISLHRFRDVLLSEAGLSVPPPPLLDTTVAGEAAANASARDRAPSAPSAYPPGTRPATTDVPPGPREDLSPDTDLTMVPPGSVPARLPKAAHRPGVLAHDTRTVGAEVEAVLTPGLSVVHAGLVLIAPFLPRFFETLEICLSSDPAEGTGADLAPLLVHLLATGAGRAAEHDLAVPKLLCGVPFAEPVVCEHAFPEAALAEAGRLLASVVQYWAALKSTSTQGLRESFLQRPGLLRDTGPQWSLHVEHRAWDILLDRVPWTFRTLRLPWMPKPLMVEWDAYA